MRRVFAAAGLTAGLILSGCAAQGEAAPHPEKIANHIDGSIDSKAVGTIVCRQMNVGDVPLYAPVLDLTPKEITRRLRAYTGYIDASLATSDLGGVLCEQPISRDTLINGMAVRVVGSFATEQSTQRADQLCMPVGLLDNKPVGDKVAVLCPAVNNY